MSNRLGFLSVTGAMVAAIALLILVAWTMVSGPVLFSPGGLNSAAHAKTVGGVASHAQLGGRCEACHTFPWNSQTMADRCIACHTDVGAEIQAHSGFHGGLFRATTAASCRECHPEHRGPNGALTMRVDHSKFPFKLTGKHVGIACDRCHTTVASILGMQNTPQDCAACHAKDDNHAGKFGMQCGQCHSTDAWTGATFDHKIFPVNHGEGQAAECKTCHPNDVSTYTCYGCHEHTPANVASRHSGQNIADITDCIKCHAGGRGGD